MGPSERDSSVRYSVCIPVLNDANTVQRSLASLYAQLPSGSEVIVVDGKSRDGTTEILRHYEERGLLKLVVKRSNVGRARQIGFQMSSGDYILSGADTDDIIGTGRIPEVLSLYHSQYEGSVLRCFDFFVIPRAAVLKAGGWRDTGGAEDLQFLADCEAHGVKVVYRMDIKVKSHYRTRYYKGPIRVLESIRRFPRDTKAGYTKLRTKPSTRLFWRLIQLFANTKAADNKVVSTVFDFVIRHFGVSA